MNTTRKLLRWLASFLEETTPQSMTRLCALLCCLAGCVVALRTPEHPLTVSALIGGGAVAILLRKQTPDAPEAST